MSALKDWQEAVKRLASNIEGDVRDKRQQARLLLAEADALEPQAIRLRVMLQELGKDEVKP